MENCGISPNILAEPAPRLGSRGEICRNGPNEQQSGKKAHQHGLRKRSRQPSRLRETNRRGRSGSASWVVVFSLEVRLDMLSRPRAIGAGNQRSRLSQEVRHRNTDSTQALRRDHRQQRKAGLSEHDSVPTRAERRDIPEHHSRPSDRRPSGSNPEGSAAETQEEEGLSLDLADQ
jgi:hypothetical protein